MKNRNKKKRWAIGIAVIFISVLMLSLIGIQNNSVYFYTPKEAFDQASKLHNNEIRVGGMVKNQSIVWNRETLNLDFILTDFKGVEIKVHHVGTPPDMFKENSGVVVEGKLNKEGIFFNAKKLMVKHSEDYRKPEGGAHPMDKAMLEKSMFNAGNNG